MAVYATTADLGQELLTRITADPDRLLAVASRDVDTALLCAVYDVDDVTGLPTDADVLTALTAATVEQVYGYVEAGDQRATGAGQPQSFSIGSLSVQRGQQATGPAKVGDLYRGAWLVLQQAGLTGYGPGDA
ncbi:MAG: hypothetical protein JXA67_20505 [Micromonosporaceae bacterium]|nr:hypothetical protein [Micromonosporaceae bacterium]